MNERIRELLEQAGVKYVTMPKDTVYEKFAELIVRECIQAVDNVGGYNEEFHMNAIKEHFGVKE
jgi:hypothetical protein